MCRVRVGVGDNLPYFLSLISNKLLQLELSSLQPPSPAPDHMLQPSTTTTPHHLQKRKHK